MIEFPYTQYKGTLAPIVSLTLNVKNRPVRIWTYVDSGASYSIFKTVEAEKAGIDYKTGKELKIMVGDGNLIPVYTHKLKLTISDASLEAVIGFSEKLGVGFNLLGRADIFRKFTVCFNDQKSLITFTPNF